ncbi:hypothetical protein [Xanthomonas graminis]|uniref:hypothetical protein n=1 Tax=Xanthomonas graminis TaxID=3390026 RepID=UPI000587E3AA|nr:hypothetical protein [Xanthomonas translucens]OAX60662.1 hypothetical protein A6R72_13805 [Xanthomonas translucens pv. graminis]UKE55568.1 hypothetical protein KFS84_07525 [Xanthomonas translucens pv. graminis]WIH09941.1 hypothetical protein KM579_08120 [Xanthomonas translucens pv. graminis]WIH11322.1 hypothetical protein KM563_13865 [Xanthomonas translucens pv. graminis]WIH14975.1 hypothetical protein KM433_13585 [Xanthomonas translucens pv. graminis]
MPSRAGAAVAIAACRAAAPSIASRVALAAASLIRGRTPHPFWVYRLLRFEHARGACAAADLPGLPKWILYSARPHNSHAVMPLGSAPKRASWAAREHGRIAPAAAGP